MHVVWIMKVTMLYMYMTTNIYGMYITTVDGEISAQKFSRIKLSSVVEVAKIN